MIHALTLLLITLFFGRWAALIPLATLAAILVVVSYHMSEWRTFRSELTAPKSDVVVLITTFALTVLVDLTVAIEVGMVLAAFLFMRRMAEVTNVSIVTRELADGKDTDEEEDPNSVRRRLIPPSVEVFEINGPFFFAAAEQFKDTLSQIAKKPRVLIIECVTSPRSTRPGCTRYKSSRVVASMTEHSSSSPMSTRNRCSRSRAPTYWRRSALTICSGISTTPSTTHARISDCPQSHIRRKQSPPWRAKPPKAALPKSLDRCTRLDR